MSAKYVIIQSFLSVVLVLWPPILYRSMKVKIFYLSFFLSYFAVLLLLNLYLIFEILREESDRYLLVADVSGVSLANVIITLKVLSKRRQISALFKILSVLNKEHKKSKMSMILLETSIYGSGIISIVRIIPWLSKNYSKNFAVQIAIESHFILQERLRTTFLVFAIVIWQMKDFCKHFNENLIKCKDLHTISKLKKLQYLLLNCIDNANDSFGAAIFFGTFSLSLRVLFHLLGLDWVQLPYDDFLIKLASILFVTVSCS